MLVNIRASYHLKKIYLQGNSELDVLLNVNMEVLAGDRVAGTLDLQQLRNLLLDELLRGLQLSNALLFAQSRVDAELLRKGCHQKHLVVAGLLPIFT